MENFTLNLKTTNKNNLNIEGVVILDILLKSDTEILKVSFIVTNEFLENRIFIYNLIEELVVSNMDDKTFEILKSMLEGAETVLAIMQKVKDLFNALGETKAPNRIIVPTNSVIKVKCWDNIKFDSKIKSVFFQPLLEPEASDTWENEESYDTTSKDRTVRLFVNLSRQDIVVPRRNVFETLHNVSAVISLLPESSKHLGSVNEINKEPDVLPNEKWQTKTQLSDLNVLKKTTWKGFQGAPVF